MGFQNLTVSDQVFMRPPHLRPHRHVWLEAFLLFITKYLSHVWSGIPKEDHDLFHATHHSKPRQCGKKTTVFIHCQTLNIFWATIPAYSNTCTTCDCVVICKWLTGALHSQTNQIALLLLHGYLLAKNDQCFGHAYQMWGDEDVSKHHVPCISVS